jgi:hypothetical protein
MKRILICFLIGALCVGCGWAAFQAAAPPEPPLSRDMPAGALLYLQAKDFSSLLRDWNASPEKRAWLGSSNYEVFSRSRLLLRLRDASRQFAAAAGLPPDMNSLSQVAGDRSALALYDIGKLQFLYITRLPSTNSTQTQLWQSRARFETRSAGGTTFYLRRDPESEREVEFAVTGNYLLLATREDLIAGALQLLAGSRDRTIEAEPWWERPVSAAFEAGDLRMVLNLEKIVPSPYFRSYWVQQNITDMKQYSAAVSDLFRSGSEYREERVLIKKSEATHTESSAAGKSQPALKPVATGGVEAAAELVRLVPESAGFYEAKADPSPDSCLHLLETKLVAPHRGPAPPAQIAPQVQLTSGETGSSTDLETRIDQAPTQDSGEAEGSSALKEVLHKNPVLAALQVQSTEQDKDGVFVRISSAIALAGNSRWDESGVRGALVSLIHPSLTASELGVRWKQANGYYQLDGLRPLLAAVRGKYFVLSDDPTLLGGMLANESRKSDLKPAMFLAGFGHKQERAHFASLTTVIDRPETGTDNVPRGNRQPQFLSENITSLTSTLAAVSSEAIVVRDAGDRVLQTVTYQWSQ